MIACRPSLILIKEIASYMARTPLPAAFIAHRNANTNMPITAATLIVTAINARDWSSMSLSQVHEYSNEQIPGRL
jgi:hypothetical protein